MDHLRRLLGAGAARLDHDQRILQHFTAYQRQRPFAFLDISDFPGPVTAFHQMAASVMRMLICLMFLTCLMKLLELIREAPVIEDEGGNLQLRFADFKDFAWGLQVVCSISMLTGIFMLCFFGL